MATLTVKPSVRFKAFTPALLRILRAAWAVTQDLGDQIITSANDSTHGPTSRHYSDEALDFRVHHLPSEAARLRLATALRVELGPAFTVLYEGKGTPNAHLHCQPRKGTSYTGPV